MMMHESCLCGGSIDGRLRLTDGGEKANMGPRMERERQGRKREKMKERCGLRVVGTTTKGRKGGTFSKKKREKKKMRLK